jgi:exodeoxyribonuclease VII small subunit
MPDPEPKTTAAPGSAERSAIADPKDFEQAMKALETIVDELEQGDLTLEQSLAAFERGIGLSRTCQQALDAAEQRVRILTEGAGGGVELEPFPGSETAADGTDDGSDEEEAPR